MGVLRNENAEKAILGAILLDNTLYAEAARLGLNAADFSLDSHSRIFGRMRDLLESDRPVDTIALVDELEKHKDLHAVGDVAYVASLMLGIPEPPNISNQVQIVLAASTRRRAAKQIEKATRSVEDCSVPISALAEMGNTLAHIQQGVILPPQFSEDAIALRFSRKHADDWRYIHPWNSWMRWDGERWIVDTTLHVFDLARRICREASAECGDSHKTIAPKLASRATSAAVERLAASDRRHSATVEQWDTDPWLLNTPTGTIDLRNGVIREHRREDFLTKITAVSPNHGCNLWLYFLDRITAGNSELQAFLQRMVGYCLTGSTREHALFFLYGTGANGKSVLLSTISELLGDYAKTAPTSCFTACANQQHPTELAGLRGARFVTVAETEDGAHWAESKIKTFTGGDKIAARFMRGDYFEFRPEAKLVIAGNHKPSLRSVDEAIRRRLCLVPLCVTIPEAERDPRLSEKLRSEFSGILAWAVQGCLD
jgi:putative DNA primase/helicase